MIAFSTTRKTTKRVQNVGRFAIVRFVLWHPPTVLSGFLLLELSSFPLWCPQLYLFYLLAEQHKNDICVNINTSKQETAFSPACPTTPVFINDIQYSQWSRRWLNEKLSRTIGRRKLLGLFSSCVLFSMETSGVLLKHKPCGSDS